MQTFKKFVKAPNGFQLNHGQNIYNFGDNEVIEVEFESSYYYDIIMRDCDLVESCKAEYDAYEIPIILPIEPLDLTNVPTDDSSLSSTQEGSEKPDDLDDDNLDDPDSMNFKGDEDTVEVSQEEMEVDKPEEYPCPLCNRSFGTQRGINMHISRTHTISK